MSIILIIALLSSGYGSSGCSQPRQNRYYKAHLGVRESAAALFDMLSSDGKYISVSDWARYQRAVSKLGKNTSVIAHDSVSDYLGKNRRVDRETFVLLLEEQAQQPL